MLYFNSTNGLININDIQMLRTDCVYLYYLHISLFIC